MWQSVSRSSALFSVRLFRPLLTSPHWCPSPLSISSLCSSSSAIWPQERPRFGKRRIATQTSPFSWPPRTQKTKMTVGLSSLGWGFGGTCWSFQILVRKWENYMTKKLVSPTDAWSLCVARSKRPFPSNVSLIHLCSFQPSANINQWFYRDSRHYNETVIRSEASTRHVTWAIDSQLWTAWRKFCAATARVRPRVKVQPNFRLAVIEKLSTIRQPPATLHI